jgi:hypothetical protein
VSAGCPRFEDLAMTEKEEEKGPPEIANELEKFAGLLDPHLADSSEVKKSASTERWSALKATIFILGTSLILWALVIALIYYLL